MPDQKNKRMTLTELFSQMDDVLKQSVSYEELKQAMDLFIQKFREIQDSVEQKTAENKAEMASETERLGKQVAEFEARLREVINDSGTSIQEKVDILANELRAEIGYVESLVEYYDDAELRTDLSDVKARLDALTIPDEFDATEINEKLEKHEREIEELKKRPVGAASGGGVRRVFQPYLSRFQGDGSTKTFYLKREPLRTDNISVSCTDFPIILDPENDFTVTGKALTLSANIDAPTNGATIVVTYYA